eukprot:6206435-Pleurochrysis_carterae.AAC.4
MEKTLRVVQPGNRVPSSSVACCKGRREDGLRKGDSFPNRPRGKAAVLSVSKLHPKGKGCISPHGRHEVHPHLRRT